MFVQFNDVRNNTRRMNLLFDRIPILLNNGVETRLTNTVDLLHDHGDDLQVLEAIKALVLTREPQSVGAHLTIKLF